MKTYTLLFTFLLTLFLVSCSSSNLSYMLKRHGIYEDKAIVYTYTNIKKTVAYIPMRHVGTKGFYQNVTSKVDSLQAKGFIVFMEGTPVDSINLTKAQQDTVKLKMRWITGIALNKKGYLNTINGTLMGKRFKNKKGIINQPRYRNLGIDTLKDKLADVETNLLVDEYERVYGKITLSDCDYKTSQEKQYKCHTIDHHRMDYIILYYRNKKLAEAIMKEQHNKIAILYGARHETGMFEELKALDPNWRKVLNAAEIRDHNIYR